jgi:hypothetical protein
MIKNILFALFTTMILSFSVLGDEEKYVKFTFDSAKKLTQHSSPSKGVLLMVGKNVSFSPEGVSGGCLSYASRSDSNIAKSVLTLPKKMFAANRFMISFKVKLQSQSIHLGRDMYLLSGNNLFIRYAVDRRAFEFGIRVGGRWSSVKTPLNKFVPRKEKWYDIAGGFDGSQIVLYLNGKVISKKSVEGDCPLTRLVVGACSWNKNLKCDGDFLMDDLVLSLSPQYPPQQIKRKKSHTKTKKKEKKKLNDKISVKNGGFSDRPFVLVPKTKRPPAMNGVVDNSWQGAAWVGIPSTGEMTM